MTHSTVSRVQRGNCMIHIDKHDLWGISVQTRLPRAVHSEQTKASLQPFLIYMWRPLAVKVLSLNGNGIPRMKQITQRDKP